MTVVRQEWQSRIIPADAGSTLDKPRVVIRDEDHPRGCGEHTSSRPTVDCP